MTLNSPRERRHIKNKQTILDAARKMIINSGHENISLREIARQADYSPAGLYEYFKNKEEILSALAEQVGQNLIANLQEIPETLSPSKRLVELALAYVDFAISNKEQFQLMNALPSSRRSLEEPVRTESSYNIFLQSVQSTIDAGEIKSSQGYSSEEITYSLWALIHGMATLRLTHLQNFQADFAEIDRKAINTFLQGLK